MFSNHDAQCAVHCVIRSSLRRFIRHLNSMNSQHLAKPQ